ncbi:hypothetical protein ACSSV4_002212 [Roseovarius sp. MBR-154]|jgi:hypothetical protein
MTPRHFNAVRPSAAATRVAAFYDRNAALRHVPPAGIAAPGAQKLNESHSVKEFTKILWRKLEIFT